MNQESQKTSYDVEWEVESFHWWFVVRRKLLGLLLSSMDFPSEGVALDVGCGVGSNLKILKATGVHAIGLDRSIYALSLLNRRLELPLINGDLNKLPIRSQSVGLIVAMDILEHLEYDVNGIGELYRVLKKEGILILTVPAFQFLWGIQDLATKHMRRYSKREITTKLNQEGFGVLRSSYFNFFLFFPILFGRRMIHLLRLKMESENKINSPLINFLFKSIFSLEPYILKYFPFPFGVSIYCVAKK